MKKNIIVFLLSALTYNSYEVLHNHLKAGELIAILGMCATLIPSVVNLAMISIPINEAKIAFDRMFEFTGIKPEQSYNTTSIVSFESLVVSNLLFRFTGRSHRHWNTHR